MRVLKISIGMLGLMLATGAASAPGQHCDEEQQQAAAWIQWATEKRAACLINATDSENRTSCLNQVRQELTALEKEHSRVYSDQIRTLHPEHPVVRNLLARLRDNVHAAEAAINTDAETEQIAAFRKQICLNRR